MAYYPAEDITVVYGKTEEEIKANIQAKMAEGYAPISDTAAWQAKLPPEGKAYRQAMVKTENTDPQFIADMYAAFKPALDDIRAQLANINSKLTDANAKLDSTNAKLDTANGRLSTIANNTGRIPEQN